MLLSEFVFSMTEKTEFCKEKTAPPAGKRGDALEKSYAIIAFYDGAVGNVLVAAVIRLDAVEQSGGAEAGHHTAGNRALNSRMAFQRLGTPAWGGICDTDMVALNLSADHKTVANLNACPPLLVGVGVAASVETAALLSL